MPEVTSVTIDDFSGGIDRREGLASRNVRRFQEIENYRVSQGGKLVRRPPAEQLLLQVDTANTKGFEYLNGQYITIAPAGSTVSHGTELPITTLYFDIPDNALSTSADWQLLDLVVFNEQVCAYILHRFPHAGTEWRGFLHVWDDKRPTWVEDPACPTTWSKTYPLHPYGAGEAGSYLNYRPRLAVAGERLAVTTPNGDVALSGVTRPRVWNDRTPDEILSDGEWWYWITTGASTTTVVVPIPLADLQADGKWAAYVCEKMQADGTWSQFTETVGPSAAGQYGLTATTRYGEDATILTIYTPAGTLVRFRALAKPAVQVLSGLYLVADGTVLAGKAQFEGGAIDIGALNIIPEITPGVSFAIFVKHPSSPVAVPSVVPGATRLALLNGQQRYWSRMIAEVDADYAVGTQRTSNVVGKRGSSVEYEIFPATGLADANWISSGVIPYTPPALVGLSIGSVVQSQGIRFRIDAFRNTSLGGTAFAWWLATTALDPIAGSSFDTAVGAFSSSAPWYDILDGATFTYAASGTGAITSGSTRVTGSSTAFLTEIKIGDRIEVDGQFRAVASIADNTKLDVTEAFTLTSSGQTILKDNRYRYAYEVGDTGNAWYAEIEADVTLALAGSQDALTLATSLQDRSGNPPLAIYGMQNRMLVQYPTTVQLWAVGPAPSGADFRHLSTHGIGAGGNTRPEPAIVDGFTVVPTAFGPRMFAPAGNGKDYIDSVPVGDKLKGISLPDLTRAVWWPQLRCYLTTGASGGTIYCLSYHPQGPDGDPISAWSTWTVEGLTTIDRIITQGEQLLVLSGSTVYRFDPAATVYRDTTDPEGEDAYASRARWLYNTFGSPNRNKRVTRIDVAQTGKSTWQFYVNPNNTSAATEGPTVSGYTLGRAKLNVMFVAPGVAMEVTSVDEGGHELESLSIDYMLLKR